MFARLFTLMQIRRSTAFLLQRADDRMLDDIGLCRHDLQALHQGLLGGLLSPAVLPGCTAAPVIPRRRTLPVNG